MNMSGAWITAKYLIDFFFTRDLGHPDSASKTELQNFSPTKESLKKELLNKIQLK